MENKNYQSDEEFFQSDETYFKAREDGKSELNICEPIEISEELEEFLIKNKQI